MAKFKVFKLIKGKDTLEKLGYKKEFQYKYTDYNGKEITYSDLVNGNVKGIKLSDFNGAPTWYEKDIILDFNHPLVQSMYKILCSKEFIADNEKHIQKYKEKAETEWNEISKNVAKGDYGLKKYITIYKRINKEINKKVDSGVEHSEIRKWSENKHKELEQQLGEKGMLKLNLARQYLYDKALYDQYKSQELYVAAYMEKAYNDNLFIKYEKESTDTGEITFVPELDNNDIIDLTTYHLVIDIDNQDNNLKNVVYISNKTGGTMYANSEILAPFLEKELELNAVREYEIETEQSVSDNDIDYDSDSLDSDSEWESEYGDSDTSTDSSDNTINSLKINKKAIC